MTSRYFVLSWEFLQNFSNILSLCVRPHPPTIKQKQTSNVRREGGTEEGREGPHQTPFDDGNLSNNPINSELSPLI